MGIPIGVASSRFRQRLLSLYTPNVIELARHDFMTAGFTEAGYSAASKLTTAALSP